MMRILLLGANGQLGYALHRSLAGLGQLVPTTRSGRLPGSNAPCEVADLTRTEGLEELIRRIAPDTVINAAAYTAVDLAESEREAAYRVNADAVASLSQACRNAGALLVHYSTDYVFSGSGNRPWQETDSCEPINVYGASKLAGEHEVSHSGCEHMIFRTAWVYGPRGRNFLRTMLAQGMRDELRVVADQIGAPTPAAWIAHATTMALVRQPRRTGTWHLTAGGETSWHGFAQAIFEEASRAGLVERCPRLTAIGSADYPAAARRPAYSVLDNGRFSRDFGFSLPDWRGGVAQVIADLPRG